MENTVTLIPNRHERVPFIEGEFLPAGMNEYYLRDTQVQEPESGWRHLRFDEIERLVKNQNTSDNWDNILVTDHFEPKLVKNNKFYGLVRIGDMCDGWLQYHDLKLKVGITNSLIDSCDIGNYVAIHDVHYLTHYIIGDKCILFNIQEMCCTNHSKFGNGIVKDGEPEKVRIAVEVMNETASRKVYPFDGMIAADAYLEARYIDDKELQAKLLQLTQERYDSRRGYYGTVGTETVIKNSAIIKDVKIGSSCYIKGASKLKNITINSSLEEPTQIGEGVVLVNGIVGYGCHIFYSCIAVRFVMGNNSNLKYGARLINTVLGDNSTISCCEVLHSLIFPGHEQHHNNSFLVAAVLKGQTNIAAGATLGSNHNSRTNDNEIQAGRGFWPGLCSSVKHSCRFASFTLLSKADYPVEMDIKLPFSLVNNNTHTNELEVMPAFWWLYNMYALARNSWKYQSRDKRKRKHQHIEFDTYAPDSMEEVIAGRKLLEIWTAKAAIQEQGKRLEDYDYKALRELGKTLLQDKNAIKALEIFGEDMEKSRRKVRILKVYEAYHAYGDMLIYYAIRNVLAYLKEHPQDHFDSMVEALKEDRREKSWNNLGGQLMMTRDLDQLREDIKNGSLASWDDIHHRYDEIWKKYTIDKLRHAYLSLCYLLEVDSISKEQWQDLLNKAIDIQEYVCQQVYISRKKDYENIYRRNTYRNEEEMIASVGLLEDNSFIKQVREETALFKQEIENLSQRL
ncbi:MAG: DUF4954 family protein [Bacteroidales bacterium]|nr:DUF4954 family protein [Bacteroidales bacterium]